MHTLTLNINDSFYGQFLSFLNNNKSSIDVLDDTVDDGYPAISFEEAQARVAGAVDRYRDNPQSFTELDDNFWNDTEARLIQRHQK
jgi:hypothetical protein